MDLNNKLVCIPIPTAAGTSYFISRPSQSILFMRIYVVFDILRLNFNEELTWDFR